MPRRARVLALSLGLGLAAALGACGSDDAQETGATVDRPPLTTPTSTIPSTIATTTATVGTTTLPAVTATTTTPATTTPPASTTPPTDSPGAAPAGCPTAVGGFIRDVQTSGTDCGVARTVANAWFDAVHEGAAPDAPIEAAGYACDATLAGERANVTCHGSGGSVAFTASP